jgi:predicted MFS family arabinose efflux permease
MSSSSSPAAGAQSAPSAPVSTWLTLLLATACGLIVANVYYAQPLIGPISQALGLSPGAAGLIVMLTQIGYGLGLLFVVPLADLVENRRLVLAVIAAGTAALLAAGLSSNAASFLAASFFIGVGSVTVQILVPYAAHMAPEAIRGKVVGNVMSGLMLGIMLARPVASFVTDLFSWHAIFFLSALVMVLLALVLRRALPPRRPKSTLRYGALLASMGQLVLHTPVLRRRAMYHAFMFGAFSLFWTAVPLLLAGPAFHMSQSQIALFALAGAAGAIAAPIAGRMADRGWSRPATVLAMLAAALSFLINHLGEAGSTTSLVLLVAAAILLDFGITTNMVLGQRAIFALGAEVRSRLNALYMATFFVGGAIGSALGAWSYAQGGWSLTAWVGMALPVAALLYSATGSARRA